MGKGVFRDGDVGFRGVFSQGPSFTGRRWYCLTGSIPGGKERREEIRWADVESVRRSADPLLVCGGPQSSFNEPSLSQSTWLLDQSTVVGNVRKVPF